MTTIIASPSTNIQPLTELLLDGGNTLAHERELTDTETLIAVSFQVANQDTNLNQDEECLEDYSWSLVQAKPESGKFWTVTLDGNDYHFKAA